MALSIAEEKYVATFSTIWERGAVCDPYRYLSKEGVMSSSIASETGCLSIKSLRSS